MCCVLVGKEGRIVKLLPLSLAFWDSRGCLPRVCLSQPTLFLGIIC